MLLDVTFMLHLTKKKKTESINLMCAIHRSSGLHPWCFDKFQALVEDHER